MNREYRFKLGGLIFFILIFCITISTTDGFKLIFNSINGEMGSTILAIIGLFAIYASSEGFGYIFNSIFFVCWSRIWPKYFQKTNQRGYSADQEKYFYSEHIKNRILNFGVKNEKTIPQEIQEYSLDTYYWYFFQPYSPKTLIEWTERRWTHFAAGMTEIVAIIFAWIVTLIVIYEQNWSITYNTALVFVFSVFFILICYYNANLSRKDALQIMDLWVFANFDDNGKFLFEKYERMINKPSSSKDND